jgi:hypothetical protein
LSTTRTFSARSLSATSLPLYAGLALLLTITPRTFAQRAEALPTNTTPQLNLSEATLPDAPGISSSSDYDDQQTNKRPIPADQAPQEPQPGQPATSIKSQPVERGIFGLGYSDAYRASHEASTTEKYILPGQLAPKLDVGDKIELGFIHGISLYSAAGWVVSSGYSHIVNTTPNYGTDSGAYGQRLGAAALRGYSDEVLRDSVMANVFHQDPRYYKMGPRHNVVVRTLYSTSRIFVTRGDDGSLQPNYSLIAGNAMGAALTNAYYPDVNRGFGQTMETFGTSMYGSAFSFFAAEFLSGALEAAHLKQARY